MLYALYGCIFGFFIPYIARRFSKFMPATFAYGLYRTFTNGKRRLNPNSKHQAKQQKLRKTYLYRSILSAGITAIISYLAYRHFGTHGIALRLTFIWLLLLLAEIDYRIYLLPDILTIPFLLLGLVASTFDMGFIFVQESVIAATIGYFFPVIVSLLFVWKNKDAFGGGDIKLLSGLGAWLGLEPLIYSIILSAIIFAIYALTSKRRTGAYGPAIALSAIIIAFYYF